MLPAFSVFERFAFFLGFRACSKVQKHLVETPGCGGLEERGLRGEIAPASPTFWKCPCEGVAETIKPETTLLFFGFRLVSWGSSEVRSFDSPAERFLRGRSVRSGTFGFRIFLVAIFAGGSFVCSRISEACSVSSLRAPGFGRGSIQGRCAHSMPACPSVLRYVP